MLPCIKISPVFVPESNDAPENTDKDYNNIIHVVNNLDNNEAALVTKSIYDRITHVTKRTMFKYYGPNILHCIFSAAVAAVGVTSIACTLGAAAPIVFPAVLGGLSSVLSTGTYDIAKRVLDREDNEYQDAINNMKLMYRNMTYYAADIFMKGLGQSPFWFIAPKEKLYIHLFLEKAIAIAVKNNRQLRLKVGDTIEILSPMLFLYRLSTFPEFFPDSFVDKLSDLRSTTNPLKQSTRIRELYKISRQH